MSFSLSRRFKEYASLISRIATSSPCRDGWHKFNSSLAPLIAFLMLIGLSATASFAQDKEVVATDYERFPAIARLDLNEQKVASIKGDFFWLDDERFMFSAQLEGPGGKPQLSSDPGKYKVLLWNIGTNKVSTHMAGEVRCVNPQDGYVQIHSPAPDENLFGRPPKRYLKGYWGAEGSGLQPYDFYFESKEPGKGGYVNRFSCRYYAGWVHDLMPGDVDVVFPLREDHGVIHFNILNVPIGANAPHRIYFRPIGAEIDHPISYRVLEIFLHTHTEFISFENVYLLQGNMHQDNDINPQEKIPRPIRLLKLDGSVQVVSPPAFLWEGTRSGYIAAKLSRLGVLWRYSGTHHVPGLNGVWLQEGNRFTRILPGTSWSVSPSGCRVASKTGSEISIIELCKKQ